MSFLSSLPPLRAAAVRAPRRLAQLAALLQALLRPQARLLRHPAAMGEAGSLRNGATDRIAAQP